MGKFAEWPREFLDVVQQGSAFGPQRPAGTAAPESVESLVDPMEQSFGVVDRFVLVARR